MDDHGSGTSPRIVAIAPQAWSEAPIRLIKKDSTTIKIAGSGTSPWEEEEEEEFT